MITENKTYVALACSAGVTEFDFDFFVTKEEDIACFHLSTTDVITDLVNPTHFTVASIDWTAGGTVTIGTAYTDGTLYIFRENDFKQSAQLLNDPSIEIMMDKLTAELQELKERIDNCVQFPIGDGENAVLPPAGVRGSMTLGTDVDGGVIPVSSTIASANVTPAMETLLDDTTIAAARTTLDVYSKTEVDTPRPIEITVTMQETVAAEDPIGLSDGVWVKAKSEWLEVDTQYSDSTNPISQGDVFQLSSGVFCVVWIDGVDNACYARIGTITSGAIAWLTAQTEIGEPTSTSFQYFEGGAVDSDRFVCIWKDTTQGDSFVRVMQYSSGTSTIVAVTDEASSGLGTVAGGTAPAYGVCHLGSGVFTITGVDAAGDVQVRIGHESGGSVTWDTALTEVQANPAWTPRIRAMGNKFIVSYWDGASPYYPYVRVGHLGTSVVDWDCAATVIAEGTGGARDPIGIAYHDDLILAFWTDTTNSQNKFKMLKLPASSGDYIDRWTGTEWRIDDIAHTIGMKVQPYGDGEFCMTYFKVGADGEVLCKVGRWDRSNGIEWITPRVSPQLDAQYAAQLGICRVGTDQFVVVYEIVGSNEGYIAAYQHTEALGVATEAITATNTGDIQIGEYQDCFAGLTVGAKYYVDYATPSISTSGHKYYGRAISATEIIKGS